MSQKVEAVGSGWQQLGGGSWLFDGKRFADDRGTSVETIDLTDPPPGALGKFAVAQENLVDNAYAGCVRGLHYQAGPFAQAKLVTLVRGSAQLLWLPLEQTSTVAEVYSVVLNVPGQSHFTPGDCAHGILALEDDTQFLLKMSSPISVSARREVNLMSDSLSVSFARPVRDDLLSDRDRHARHWSPRDQGS